MLEYWPAKKCTGKCWKKPKTNGFPIFSLIKLRKNGILKVKNKGSGIITKMKINSKQHKEDSPFQDTLQVFTGIFHHGKFEALKSEETPNSRQPTFNRPITCSWLFLTVPTDNTRLLWCFLIGLCN